MNEYSIVVYVRTPDGRECKGWASLDRPTLIDDDTVMEFVNDTLERAQLEFPQQTVKKETE